LKIRLCVICLIAVFALYGCAGSVPTKISFVQSDLEASWSMVGHGRERGIKFNSLGSLILGASGEVAGGDTHEFGVDMKSFTGGRVPFPVSSIRILQTATRIQNMRFLTGK